MEKPPWISVEDYKVGGWVNPQEAAGRGTACCEMLERGEILFFRELPFELAADDRTFLVTQQWTELRMHKNISYRPSDDSLRGVSGDSATESRMHSILSSYSANAISFLKKFLSPWADKWILDFASFRPFEEQNRGLPLHKRNDLLHVDAFPSRPTRGGRILRVFTNVNPSKSRVWQTTEGFPYLASHYAEEAGLRRIARSSALSRKAQDWGHKLGFRGMGRTPYDIFMLRFHDYLKENSAFQQDCPKVRLEFPPFATWLVLTDGVAHAAMSGQYALEQTVLIPADALVSPKDAPYRILEKIAGCSLVS